MFTKRKGEAMDILQLEHFVAVVEEGSFSRAAEKVFRTQPAISQSIKKLEDEVGAPLFARDMHDIALTEAGKVLVDYANRMLRLRDETVHALDELRSLGVGSLSIGAPESAALYLLPGPLHEFLHKHPGIKVGIYRRRMDEITRQVMDREIDVGFVLSEPVFKELRSVPIYQDEMVLIASPEHSMIGRGNLRVEDLGEEHFVFHHLCTPTSHNVAELFERYRTRLNIVAELWGYESIKTFVRQGVGLAIVPRITALEELRNGQLASVPVQGLHVPRQTFMIYRDPQYMTYSAREFLRTMTGYSWTWDDTVISSSAVRKAG
jgi:DNA-binding transcriptional LysR family regulator